VKEKLAELLGEMRASLPHFGFDAALTATALARIDQLLAMLARADATRDEIAWHAFTLGGLWGQPMVDKYFKRQDRDAAAGRKGRKNRAVEDSAHLEKVFAEIDARLADEPNDSAIARAVHAIDIPNQPTLSVSRLRRLVAERRRIAES
jgi:hypothetical protein